MLAVADALAGAAAGLVVAAGFPAGLWGIAFVPLWLVLAKLLGLYDRDHRAIRHLTVDEMPAIALWATGVVAGLALLLPLTPAGSLTLGEAAAGWAVAAGAVTLLRGTARLLWRWLTPPELAIVIGAGPAAEAVRRKMELFGDMHMRLAEHAESVPAPNGSRARARAVEEIVRRAERVVVASPDVDPELIALLRVACRESKVKLSVISPLRGKARPALRISQVADLPVLEYNTWDVSRSTMLLKRGFDLALAAPAVLLLVPLLPVMAVAIKLESPGPLLFRQRRAGRGGRPFTMYKLRTMYEGADEDLSDLVRIEELEEPVFKLRRDPRVTRVGRVLRRFSLDEVPQLWNVLRGEMSIVGTRPEEVDVVRRYAPEHRFRLDVKPGLTGPMQVFGRGELSFEERLAVELDYIEHLSLSRDIRILSQTLPAIVRGTGAF